RRPWPGRPGGWVPGRQARPGALPGWGRRAFPVRFPWWAGSGRPHKPAVGTVLSPKAGTARAASPYHAGWSVGAGPGDGRLGGLEPCSVSSRPWLPALLQAPGYSLVSPGPRTVLLPLVFGRYSAIIC